MTVGYRESAAEDRTVLVVSFNGWVFGLDPATGTPKWEHRLGHGEQTELLIAGGRVYVTNSRVIVCLDYTSGEVLGRVDVPDTYKGRATMVIERDALYLASSGEVTCFGLDLEHLWTQAFAGKGLGGVALGFPGNLRQADDRGAK